MKAMAQTRILKKVTKILAGSNIDVYMEGFQPRVEYNPKTKLPVRVFLPEIPDGASDALINAIEGYIDHEVGHILESNADDICDLTKSQLWGFLHNCIEDPRVNAKMSERFVGSEANIRNGYKFLFDRTHPVTGKKAYSKEMVDAIDLSDDKAVKDAQVNYACVWFAKKANCRFSSEIYDEMGLERLFDPLEAKVDPRFLDALSRANTTEEVKEAADYYEEFFQKEFKDPPLPPPPASGKSGGKKELEKGRLESPPKMEDELAEAIKQEIEHLAKKAKSNIYFSDRFDRTHSKADIIGSDIVNIADYEDKTKTVTNFLSKDLRRMLESRNRRWYVGGYKSGKLNQKALHSVKVGNDRIFSKKSDIKAVKAAVSLLIDMSGSMNYADIIYDEEGKSTGKRGQKRVDLAIQSAYAFGMVLDQLKVPYEIWGFSTGPEVLEKTRAYEKWSATVNSRIANRVISPSTAEDLYAFKTFNEAFDVVSKGAMVKAAKGVVGMHNNEDSLHVKRALERLSQRTEDQKTLFVFSDGQPCFGPGNVRASMEQLKYLDAVSKSEYGVDMFGIGIQSDAVKHYYSKYKVVEDLSELPSALFDFLRTRI